MSIVIPAYNAQSILRSCLDSVMKLDYPKDKLEVILVNNNSSDSTEDIARSYPITVLREENVQSSYAARNRGIQDAKGEIIAFTDTDCIVSPDWLRKLLASFRDPEIGCVAGNIESYQPRTLAECFADVDEENHNQQRELTVGYLPAANTANVAFRHEVFQTIGPFNSGLKSGGDAELTWRMVIDGKYQFRYEPDAVVYHRHRSSLRELYLQHRKYGESITELLRLYPGSCADTLCFVKDIFHFGSRGLTSLPKNLFLYYRGNISRVEMCYDLLKSMCRLGLVMGRVRAQGRRENGEISNLLVTKYLFLKLFLRLKSKVTT